MRTLYFDRNTLKGKSNKSSNLDVEKVVNDDCNITKTIPEYDKDIQKVDEQGNLIYLKNIYEMVQKEEILGTEITTEVTDTPYIKNIWKTDENGFKLYAKKIYGEDGEPTGEIEEVTDFMNIFTWKEEVYYETTEKVVGKDSDGNPIYDYEKIPHTYSVPDKYEYNEPVYIDFHMEDKDGNKLYIKEVKEVWEEREVVRVEETAEPIQVFSYKEEEVVIPIEEFVSCNHVCDESCIEPSDEDATSPARCQHEHSELCNPIYDYREAVSIVQVPDEYEENEPCMIPSYKDVTVDIFSRPEEFEITELLAFMYEQELAENDYDYILADMFINESDIDFSYDKHSANTGAFVCCLHPQGKVRLKQLELEKPARVFEIISSEIPDGIDVFINNVKFVGKKLILPKETQKCTIRFENTTDKYLDIKSYCIAY